MNKTAVVILNFNGLTLLRKFLPSVIAFSAGAEIIVADNFSADGSVEMLQAEFPTVRIIPIHENLGFCGGYNFALKQVDAQYYVLLNSDVEVTPHWLEPQTGLLDRDLMIAAVQPKILSYSTRTLFEYAGAAGGFIDTLGYPFCRGRVFDTLEEDTGQYNDQRQIFWATGACLTIRSADFRSMGGFDTDFFAHMEEIDLCWKLNRAGRKVFVAADSVVFHIGGGTLSRLNPTKTYLNFRNGLFLMLKNMNSGSLVWKLPVRIGLDWTAALAFFFRGEFRNFGAVLKAHLHVVAGAAAAIRKRRQFNALGFEVKSDTIYPKSIIFSYFGARKKTFKELGF